MRFGASYFSCYVVMIQLTDLIFRRLRSLLTASQLLHKHLLRELTVSNILAVSKMAPGFRAHFIISCNFIVMVSGRARLVASAS
jgi:hypothetical protein